MAGRPEIEITKSTRKKIRRLAGFGLRDDQIASIVEFSESTLKSRCSEDLSAGRAVASEAVTRAAYRQAISGNTTMMIFWLKTRCGWKETNVHELVGKDGGVISVDVDSVRSRISDRLERLAGDDAEPKSEPK